MRGVLSPPDVLIRRAREGTTAGVDKAENGPRCSSHPPASVAPAPAPRARSCGRGTASPWPAAFRPRRTAPRRRGAPPCDPPRRPASAAPCSRGTHTADPGGQEGRAEPPPASRLVPSMSGFTGGPVGVRLHPCPVRLCTGHGCSRPQPGRVQGRGGAWASLRATRRNQCTLLWRLDSFEHQAHTGRAGCSGRRALRRECKRRRGSFYMLACRCPSPGRHGHGAHRQPDAHQRQQAGPERVAHTFN